MVTTCCSKSPSLLLSIGNLSSCDRKKIHQTADASHEEFLISISRLDTLEIHIKTSTAFKKY